MSIKREVKVTDVTAFGFKVHGRQYSLKLFKLEGGPCVNCAASREKLDVCIKVDVSLCEVQFNSNVRIIEQFQFTRDEETEK